MQLLRTKYHVLVFGWTFQQKVAKSGSFREKARKIIDLAKTLQLFEQTTMSLHFDELFRKKLQKGLISWKSTKNHRFGQNFATFRTNYHVFAFRWTFQEKVAKSASFREKARKTIPKLASFGANYHVLAFSWTFQQEVAKSASFREKAREIIDLAKTMQLFEQTTMFLHFDELLRKKLGKVVHFVKKHEISWIWSKLATFWKHYHVLTFR